MKKYIVLSLFMFPLVGYFSGSLVGKIQESATTAGQEKATVSVNESTKETPMATPGELVKEDLTVGTGAEAVAGKAITVHYTGWLTNGTKFDSSVDRGEPFTFQLGAGMVIQGWEQGFAGMKVGGKRKLTIPPEMGYGSRGVGTIPPNSTLVFEVELLKVE